MAEPTNEDRAEWAYSALERFAKETGQDKNGDLKHDRAAVIGDLLCNLLHLCSRDGIDFHACLQSGMENWAEELE